MATGAFVGVQRIAGLSPEADAQAFGDHEAVRLAGITCRIKTLCSSTTECLQISLVWLHFIVPAASRLSMARQVIIC